MNRIILRVSRLFLFGFVFFCCFGCVDQSQGENQTETDDKVEATLEENTESGSEETADEPVILATSVATMEICSKLGINLKGIPESSLADPPECYEGLPEIGTAMAPDMEKIAAMDPDWILSPVSLYADLQPQYEGIQTEYAFLNLSSVPGMYKSIEELGQIFGKEQEAEDLIEEFTVFYDGYQASNAGEESPSVLILMGFPGSYVAATPESYVGSLVQMAGGSNVYAGESKDYINVNTEDMLTKDPDIILRTAHALPEDVMEMFADEFENNDIWKQFTAVQEEKVYDLSSGNFGMSANFQYPDALEELKGIFYE